MSRSDLSRVAHHCLTLCEIPSVIGDERALADAVASQFAARWPMLRLGNNLVFGGPTGPARPLLAFFGHLDTVPGEAHPPRLLPDRLVALGASDMKAGLAIMTSLMETQTPGSMPFDLAFVFYDREEGPYLENGLGPTLEVLEWKHSITLGICLEPSANRLQLGCLGSLHARLTFDGRRAHSARPWEGENAIHKAGALITALAGRGVRQVTFGGLTYREVMSLTLAEGGSARNVVPDRFTVNLNFRFAPGKSLDEAQREVEALVDGAAAVTFTDLSPAGEVPLAHPWVRLLTDRLGLVPEPKQAWTDVGRLSLAGIPAVNLGPGEPTQAHQAGEWVPLSHLDDGLALIERFLDHLTAVVAQGHPAEAQPSSPTST
jgi:succinyl-diaminopimelate desuccinylase